LYLFFVRLLPTTLGLRFPFSGKWLFGDVIGPLLYGLTLCACAAALVWVLLRRRVHAELALLLVGVAAYPFLFAVPRTSYYVDEPRYGLLLAPLLVLLILVAVRSRLGRVAVLTLSIVLAIATVATTQSFAHDHPLSVDLVPERLGTLVHTLNREHVTTAYADYWIAYPLTFASNESVTATPVDAVRSAKINDTVDAAPQSTYVLFAHRPRDAAFAAQLQAQHIPYAHQDVGLFSIYRLHQQAKPDQFKSVWALPSP
jgi:hypothetical protein